ncbi:MAG: dihydroxyacetone kinase subunit L [Odoribacter splanchnicus]|nr:dihydroxyacetone kinase subunit L [Odoribacter splanchnicus]
MNLTIENFKAMMNLALANIKAREEEFSKLDAIAGDGDHGTAVVTALSIIAADAQEGTEFPAMLNDMGMGVMMKTSGSTSTLLGALFMGMGEALEPLQVTNEVNAAQLKVMFRGGLTGVQEQTKAKPGDKTMMDALVPAVEAIEACESDDVKTLLKAGAEAALKGAEATVNMKANFGRARNLGERSIGFADAGATSWACLFQSFAEGIH